MPGSQQLQPSTNSLPRQAARITPLPNTAQQKPNEPVSARPHGPEEMDTEAELRILGGLRGDVVFGYLPPLWDTTRCNVVPGDVGHDGAVRHP